MKSFLTGIITLLFLIILPLQSHACFDTYLFIQKGGMNYPCKMFAVDGGGEYGIGSFKNQTSDVLTGGINLYYGHTNRFSVQVVAVSSEKERADFRFDDLGLRGVYNILGGRGSSYNLDVILEHHMTPEATGGSYELSAPNIWRNGGLTYVFHPVAAFGRGVPAGLRGHSGVFYTTGNKAIIGLGAEYESAQSSSNLGKRLIRGETGTSIFFGSMIGPNLFLQNELIKGWGAGSDKGDTGFAFTLKVLIPR